MFQHNSCTTKQYDMTADIESGMKSDRKSDMIYDMESDRKSEI